MLTPKDPTAFIDAMADLLRLPDETLAMAYIYLHKYTRSTQTTSSPSPLDPYTLSLATLSLAAKATESPRPPSAILLRAHRLLHKTPLSTSSPTYARLRKTLIAAELILLRALGFECRPSSPMGYVGRYLARAMEENIAVAEGGREGEGGDRGGAERERGREEQHDYARWSQAERDEWGVVALGETGGGREVRGCAVKACKSGVLVGLWPSRAVALGCVWVGMERQGLGFGEKGEGGEGEWVRRVGGGKVDVGDWREVVGILRGL